MYLFREHLLIVHFVLSTSGFKDHKNEQMCSPALSRLVASWKRHICYSNNKNMRPMIAGCILGK